MMVSRMIAWAERRAWDEARREAERIAETMREALRGASVEARETQVIVSGRGLIKRWLIDPELRFLSGDRR